MPLLIPQLMSCPGLPRAEDKNVLRCLSSSTAAAERGRHRRDSGLEEKSIQAIYSRSQLDSQRALYLPEPLMKLQDVGPWGSLNQVRVGRAFC
jgi:hypothetical protein